MILFLCLRFAVLTFCFSLSILPNFCYAGETCLIKARIIERENEMARKTTQLYDKWQNMGLSKILFNSLRKDWKALKLFKSLKALTLSRSWMRPLKIIYPFTPIFTIFRIFWVNFWLYFLQSSEMGFLLKLVPSNFVLLTNGHLFWLVLKFLKLCLRNKNAYWFWCIAVV